MKYIITESQYKNILVEDMKQQEQRALQFAKDFEAIKFQKSAGLPHGSYWCKPCMLTVTGNLTNDVINQKYCVNQKLYDGRGWDCPQGYSLYSTMAKEYGISDLTDSEKVRVGNLISGLPTHQYKDFLSDPHNLLTIAAIGTSFIPIVGPFLAAGISLGDAYLYYKKNDKKMAGMMAMFALLPFGLSRLSKIPGISKFGSKEISELGKKVADAKKGTKVTFTKEESQLLGGLMKEKELVKQELSSVAKSQAAQKAQTVTNKTLQTQLSDIVKNGINVAKPLTPYGAAYAGYQKGYEEISKDNPSNITKNETWDWEMLKIIFGSSGTVDDNTKLKQAWQSGWRPGTIVPEKFRTELYKKEFNQELENIEKLNQVYGS